MKTLPFFSSNLIDPFFEVFTVLHDPLHEQHQNLIADMAAIDEDALELFVLENGVDLHLEKSTDKDRDRRAHCLVDQLQKAIASTRLIALASEEARPAPYDSSNLTDVEIDEHHLVSTGIFEGAFVYKSCGYNLCPSIGASNSSFWTTNALLRIIHARGVHFKIRLDPFIEKTLEEFNPMMYRMTVYGTPLRWSELKNLQFEDHGRWIDESQRRDYSLTDYVWRPGENEINFTCEELPTPNSIAHRGSRYFHAVFNKETGMITHCDGAIRVYTPEEYSYRLNYHVRNAEVRKIGKRIKIFQINKTSLTQEDFGLLIKSFMVWNDDVQKYFA